MVILRLVIWALLFMITTFFWVVVFEHGLSGFGSGCDEEWRKFRHFLGGTETSPAD